jgi:hypothetical protein
MSFGTAGSVSVASDPGALRAAMMLVNLVEMLADPRRAALAADLKALAEAAQQHNAMLEQIAQREAAVTHREQLATTHAEALAKERAEVALQEQRAQSQLQAAQQKWTELEQLKNEMRSWSKAAA